MILRSMSSLLSRGSLSSAWTRFHFLFNSEGEATGARYINQEALFPSSAEGGGCTVKKKMRSHLVPYRRARRREAGIVVLINHRLFY
jgi:hypothetical protein